MENEFIWRKVSEKERGEIKNEAKNLLNRFAEKLQTIKTKEAHLENNSGFRQEGEGWDTDGDFKELMLGNAPFVDDDSIVAEKGAWK